MSTLLTIETITPNLDGKTAAMGLAGVVNGALTLQAALANDPLAPRINIPFTGVFPNVVVTVPHRDVWYFWASDSAGVSPPAAQYVGLSENITLDEVGEAIVQRLENNRLGLDAALATIYQNEKTKQIVYGIPDNITDSPSILVANPKRRSERIASDFLTRNDYEFTLAFMITHSTESSELPAAVRFAEMGAKLMNRSFYYRLQAPNGEVLTDCMCKPGDYSEFAISQDDFVGWCATGTLVFTGFSHTQERTGV